MEDANRNHIQEQLRCHGIELFCSPILVDQLALRLQTRGCTAMLDTIIRVRQHFPTGFRSWPRGPRKPDKFKRDPLKGLWKAHQVPHTLSDFAKNLGNELDQNWMDKELGRYFRDHRGDFLTDENAGEIAHIAVMKGLQNRSRRNHLTSGDWLIFSELGSEIIFLCCAHHDEQDKEIFARVMQAARFYPDLDAKLAEENENTGNLRDFT